MIIYACDVNGTLCIDWLRGTILGRKAFSSMEDLREAYLKREKESRCRLLVMSSWPDDGALVMRWKKASEAHRAKFTFRKLERILFFFNLFFQSLLAYRRNSKNSRHTDARYCCLSAI